LGWNFLFWYLPPPRLTPFSYLLIDLSYSQTAKDLINKLLNTDPNKRLTAKEALAHPWVSGNAAPSTDLLPNVSNGMQRIGGKRLRAVGKAIIMANRLKQMSAESGSQ